MKLNSIKPLLLIVVLFCSARAFSQPVLAKGFQAGFDYTGSTISFKLKPVVTGTTNFSTIEFYVRVPNAAPAFTWGTINENTTNFPGMGDFFIETGTSGAFRVYHFIYTAPAVITTLANYTAGTNYEVFNVTTSVDPSTLNMQLLHSPVDEDPFYLAITNGVGADARPQDGSDNLVESAYFFPATNTSGDPFFVNLALLTAPAFFQDFNVNKQGSNSALLIWTTSQEQNVSHFILEKSWSQTSGWTAIGEVKAKGNSNTPSKYTFTDVAAYDGSSNVKTAYYRIRAVDLDAKEKIFPIRSIRFSSFGEKEITIYPNPVKDGFNISIPVLNPQNKKIRLNLVNQAGQLLHAREIAAASASNYYYDIKTPGVIAGEYMLQIIMDGALLDTKKIIVQR
jgi:hypothetical protein